MQELPESYDELPLWSAPFGLVLLETIRLRQGMKIVMWAVVMGSLCSKLLIDFEYWVMPQAWIRWRMPADKKEEEVMQNVRQRINTCCEKEGEFILSIPFAYFDCKKPLTSTF